MRRYWRLVSPSTFLLALLLFPLPWVDIACPGLKPETPKALKESGVPPSVYEPFLPQSGSVSIWTQSGLQAAFGERWSLIEQEPSDFGEQRAKQWKRIDQALTARLHGSPWMALYPFILLAGILAGLGMRMGGRRRMGIAGCAITSLLLVFVQTRIGFPVEQAYWSIPWEAVLDDPQSAPKRPEDHLAIEYTAWFWLAQLSVAGGLILVMIEGYLFPTLKERQPSESDAHAP